MNNAIVVLSRYISQSKGRDYNFEEHKRQRDTNRRSIDFGLGSSSITNLTSVRLSATLSGDAHPVYNREAASSDVRTV